METRMPNGELLRERFENEEKMNERRQELEKAGGKVERIFHVHRGRHVHKSRSKYEPHQGAKEIARRRKQRAT